MDRVIQELGLWLAFRGLPTEGIEVRIVMPTPKDASRAFACMEQDLAAYTAAATVERPCGDARIYGVDVSFEGCQD
jgi:hypothetical protein